MGILVTAATDSAGRDGNSATGLFMAARCLWARGTVERRTAGPVASVYGTSVAGPATRRLYPGRAHSPVAYLAWVGLAVTGVAAARCMGTA
jgi:hypothetical protein